MTTKKRSKETYNMAKAIAKSDVQLTPEETAARDQLIRVKQAQEDWKKLTGLKPSRIRGINFNW